MLTSRHFSQHKLKHNLNDSLRRQKELSNRISVLMFQKERRLKEIEKRMNQVHNEQQLKMVKAIHREEIQRSFQKQRRKEIYHNQMAQSIKKQLLIGVTSRQNNLLETKRKWYKEVKIMQQTNRLRINRNRAKQFENKQLNTKRVKLMEIHSKQNVKEYWKNRTQEIKKQREKQNNKNSQLFEYSINNISILQQKQRKLLEEIKQAQKIDYDFTNIMVQQQNQFHGQIIFNQERI